MLKSHTSPGHEQQEGRICCSVEAEMWMAQWHSRFNDYYDEGCLINPQAEQIKLSACKCHLMRVCAVHVRCCSAVDDERFILAVRRWPSFSLPPQSCYSFQFGHQKPHAHHTLQVHWIICFVFTLNILNIKRKLIASFIQKRFTSFSLVTFLWGNSASGLLFQVVLLSSVLTWPLATPCMDFLSGISSDCLPVMGCSDPTLENAADCGDISSSLCLRIAESSANDLLMFALGWILRFSNMGMCCSLQVYDL